MNFQFYVEKLKHSDKFKKFEQKHKDAYFCSGFFVVDKEGKDNKFHLDYYLPKQDKIVSFQLETAVQQNDVEIIDNKKPAKANIDCDFEMDNIEKMIKKEMEKQGVKNKIQKIMMSFQEIDKKDYLICTVFITMLGLLKVHINLDDKKIDLFEKKSVFDIMKVKKNGKNDSEQPVF